MIENEFVDANPYTSKEFVKIWLKHHKDGQNAISFNFIEPLQFIKAKGIPLYKNVGLDSTNGMFYKLHMDAVEKGFKGKVFIVYDVPSYTRQTPLNNAKGLKIKRIKQYKGFLTDLKDHGSIDSFMQANFKSKGRKKVNKISRKLDRDFKIRLEALMGPDTDKTVFDDTFSIFRQMLEKRFRQKKIELHWINDKSWAYLHEITYAMVLANKAVLFVMYGDEKPISMDLNFKVGNMLVGVLPAFDANYSPYQPGIQILHKILDWCIVRGIRRYDYSKGDYEYKRKWGNLEYDFYHHVIYDTKSLRSILIANLCIPYFKALYFFRRIKVPEIYRKIRHMFN